MKKVNVVSDSRDCAERVARELEQCGFEPTIADCHESQAKENGAVVFCEELALTEALERAQQLAWEMQCDIIVAPHALGSKEIVAPPVETAAMELPLSPETCNRVASPGEEVAAREITPPAPAYIATRLMQLRSTLDRAGEKLPETKTRFKHRYVLLSNRILRALRIFGAHSRSSIRTARERAGELKEICAGSSTRAAKGWAHARTASAETWAAAGLRMQSARTRLNAMRAARNRATAHAPAPITIPAKPQVVRTRRGALIASAACVLALVAGFGLGSRRERPRPRIPGQAPPAAATFVPAQLVIAPTATVAGKAMPAAKQSPSPQAKTSSPRSSARTHAAGSEPAADSEDDEVIVRHFRHPAKTRPAVARNGVKHYSDID